MEITQRNVTVGSASVPLRIWSKKSSANAKPPATSFNTPLLVFANLTFAKFYVNFRHTVGPIPLFANPGTVTVRVGPATDGLFGGAERWL